jgi:hypothetical protein
MTGSQGVCQPIEGELLKVIMNNPKAIRLVDGTRAAG